LGPVPMRVSLIEESEPTPNEIFHTSLGGSSRLINGSDAFFQNLSVNASSFGQFELSVGLLYNGLKVYYTGLHFTKSDLNNIYPTRIGITYVPSFF
jgi:hypothetical protein